MPSIPDLLSPCAPTQRGVELELKERLFRSLDLLLADPAQPLAAPLASLLPGDGDVRINLNARMRHSLRWYRQVLDRPPDELDVARLFESMTQGDWCTSPALLCLHAILSSQLGWAQPYHHDFYSSVRAEQHLLDCGLPRPFPGLVSRLVRFQNSVRTSLMPDPQKETGVWCGGALRVDDGAVRSALEYHLREGWPEKQPVAVLCAIVVALAYEQRWGEVPRSPKVNAAGAWWQDVNRSGHADAESPPGPLCAYELAHYTVAEGKLQDVAARTLPALVKDLGDSDDQVLWLSFGRFWSRHYAARLAPEDCRFRSDTATDRVGSAIPGNADHRFFRLALEPMERFQLCFGTVCTPAPREDDAWSLIRAGLDTFTRRRPWSSEIPPGAVAHVLRVLLSIWPKLFVAVRLSQRESGQPRTIALPREAPGVADLEELAHAGASGATASPKLLVARYAAAELLNQRLLHGAGPLAVALEAEPGCARRWWQAIRWVEQRNHHETLFAYVDQHASPYVTLHGDGARPPEPAEDACGLFIDVGATTVKVVCRRVNAGLELDEPIWELDYPTAPVENRRYRDGEAFAQRTRKEIEERGRAVEGLVLIGVAWPGAVAGERGAAYVSATSTIFNFFEGLSNEILANSPARIHDILRIREAFETVFARGDTRPVVRLMNDGAAHSLASLDRFEDLPQGRAAVVVSGTGTAVGLVDVRDGGVSLQPVLAEGGKVQMDLSCPLPEAEEGGYPKGNLNKYCSEKTLRLIADELLRALPGNLRDSLPLNDIEVGAYLADLVEPGRGARLLEIWWKRQIEPNLRRYGLGPIIELENIPSKRKRLLRAELGNFESDTSDEELFSIDPRTAARLQSAPPHGFDRFILEVARRAGCQLADLLAVLVDVYGCSTALVSGGPMAGATGVLVRAFARRELAEGYAFVVRENMSSDGPPGVRARVVSLPEPRDGGEFRDESALAGVAGDAVALYEQRLRDAEAADLDHWLRELDVAAEVDVSAAGVTSGPSKFDYRWLSEDEVDAYLRAHASRLGLVRAERGYLRVDLPDVRVR